VTIPGNIEPIDRGELFEDPINAALEEAGIEFDWLGGGTLLGDEPASDFSYEIADLKRGLDIISKVLKEANAPPETSIRVVDPQDNETNYRLADLV
jgi:hypothetical protein